MNISRTYTDKEVGAKLKYFLYNNYRKDKIGNQRYRLAENVSEIFVLGGGMRYETLILENAHPKAEPEVHCLACEAAAGRR